MNWDTEERNFHMKTHPLYLIPTHSLSNSVRTRETIFKSCKDSRFPTNASIGKLAASTLKKACPHRWQLTDLGGGMFLTALLWRRVRRVLMSAGSCDGIVANVGLGTFFFTRFGVQKCCIGWVFL